MLKFYDDRKQTFECKIKLEGSDKALKDAKVRLVFEDGNVQRFYRGKTDILGNCIVELPPMKEIKQRKGEVSLEVRVHDVIFEPYRNQYVIGGSKVSIQEAKVDDKIKLLKQGVSKNDKAIVTEMIKGFNKLDAKNKKVLYEYIDLKYEPSEKVMNWASKIFNDMDNMKARISMYQAENIFSKKH